MSFFKFSFFALLIVFLIISYQYATLQNFDWSYYIILNGVIGFATGFLYAHLLENKITNRFKTGITIITIISIVLGFYCKFGYGLCYFVTFFIGSGVYLILFDIIIKHRDDLTEFIDIKKRPIK